MTAANTDPRYELFCSLMDAIRSHATHDAVGHSHILDGDLVIDALVKTLGLVLSVRLGRGSDPAMRRDYCLQIAEHLDRQIDAAVSANLSAVIRGHDLSRRN